ncbi:MAG: hypothetical protein ABIS50_01205 [Luteolibacter sp.]|uniref:hypothetical protein n=1 Tax=Luteolibacter sp. TaxID=1962973 RepID=UPI003267EEBF
MSLENRIHLQSEDPDLLIEFDLPPGTHAVIGASPKSEITLPLTGIPPFSGILGRFQDGRLFIAELDHSVARRVDLPDYFSIPPYQFVLFHPAEPEAVVEAGPESKPSRGTTRDQIASSIRSLFRNRPKPAPAKEKTPPPEESPASEETPPAEPPAGAAS